MKIRFAETKDIPQLLRLLQQVGQHHHTLRPDIFRDGARKYGPSQLLTILEDPNTPVFVAEEGESILGYGFCKVKKFDKDPVFCDRCELYIDDLCVDEACRGQGIGTAIYQELLRYGKLRKCDTVTLNVWLGQGSAKEFYEKLGFAPRNIMMEQKV